MPSRWGGEYLRNLTVSLLMFLHWRLWWEEKIEEDAWPWKADDLKREFSLSSYEAVWYSVGYFISPHLLLYLELRDDFQTYFGRLWTYRMWRTYHNASLTANGQSPVALVIGITLLRMKPELLFNGPWRLPARPRATPSFWFVFWVVKAWLNGNLHSDFMPFQNSSLPSHST